jgi:hypothetical protein
MTELARLDKRLEAKVQDLFMGLPVEVRSKFGVITEDELPALTDEYMAKQDNIWKED